MGQPADALTPRERIVVDLTGEGFSSREIAVRLSVSVRTVENELASALGKLRAAGAGA